MPGLKIYKGVEAIDIRLSCLYDPGLDILHCHRGAGNYGATRVGDDSRNSVVHFGMQLSARAADHDQQNQYEAGMSSETTAGVYRRTASAMVVMIQFHSSSKVCGRLDLSLSRICLIA